MKNVVCFGEVLWDILPSGRKPGGAPMNVAYHLRRLGVESYIVSRVGNDIYGEELKALLVGMGLSTTYVQTDTVYKTSEVIATPSKNNEMLYEIVKPVAWDFITADEDNHSLIKQADMFVFGSLVARNDVTRETLFTLLDQARFKLFDVNFRPPHYTRDLIEYLLKKADAVKLNEGELAIIGSWLADKKETASESIARIQDHYQLAEIIVTKGGEGASYYTLNERYDYQAYPIEIKDTVGSGDSFLAAFIAQKLLGKPIDDILDYAAALGAYVTSQDGANPDYRLTDLNRFIWEKKLERAKWK